ncbi:MAG: redox-sensing transcriptional repressor Rex [Candidatus Omnitrophota bacterium]|nr:MAG: redox-sensing transcriptional repressor Rex [Candidatus Omnitrophota bacterium]
MKHRKKEKKVNFSPGTIKRLSLYLRKLKKIHNDDINIISSNTITRLLNVTSDQFRKDLSYFGEFGKRGVGYNVALLLREIENILGINQEWKIALVGTGKLGSALLGFEGFSKLNLKITCGFDNQKDKIGNRIGGVKINDIKDLSKIVKKQNIKIAIIATPPEVAQDVARQLVKIGIKGILNFAPVSLNVSKNIVVSNVDMATELENLIFFVKRRL